MKKLAVGSRLRILGIVLALGLTVAAMTSPAKAVGDWSGCGEPYIQTVEQCVSVPVPIIGGVFTFCWYEQQGCANCDQGTACFSLNN